MLTISELLEPLARQRSDEVVVTTMSSVRGWGRLSSHDVDFASASQVAGAITPVPGGVGPMTIACLIRNTMVSAARRDGFALDSGL